MHTITVTLAAFLLMLCACASLAHQNDSVSQQEFGVIRGHSEQQATLYTLTNIQGMKVKITDFGAILVAIEVPDRHGTFDDVVLGFDSAEHYQAKHPYFGSVIGRYAGRIANGRFTLNGQTYQLTINNGANHLHGGSLGFDKQLWSARVGSDNKSVWLNLRHTSPDGDQGFPGQVDVQVNYRLTHDNQLFVSYQATTDKATVLNLTQHSYFNLAGQGNGNILGHMLHLNADYYTPIDNQQLPTGEIAPVSGTPLDFTRPVAIGQRIDTPFAQLTMAKGYDHNFVLNRHVPTNNSLEGAAEKSLAFAATLYEPVSGRELSVYTDQPGLQLYTGNFLTDKWQGKKGMTYQHRGGVCLETQHFPDSPNQPDFPSVALLPGQTFYSTTAFVFRVRQ